MTRQMEATATLVGARTLLDRYMRDAAAAVAQQRLEVGARIREARKEKRWKQKQLAAAVHVEPLTVSRWERGQHMPDLDTLGLVAEATGKDLGYFIGEAAGVERSDGGESEILAKLDEALERLERLEQAVEATRADRSA